MFLRKNPRKKSLKITKIVTKGKLHVSMSGARHNVINVYVNVTSFLFEVFSVLLNAFVMAFRPPIKYLLKPCDTESFRESWCLTAQFSESMSSQLRLQKRNVFIIEWCQIRRIRWMCKPLKAVTHCQFQLCLCCYLAWSISIVMYEILNILSM